MIYVEAHNHICVMLSILLYPIIETINEKKIFLVFSKSISTKTYMYQYAEWKGQKQKRSLATNKRSSSH